MTYKIATGDTEGRATHWFAMFLAFGISADDDYDLQKSLIRHNANVTVPADYFKMSDEIVFASEADFLVFKLKWA